jgi:hypothetical protein
MMKRLTFLTLGLLILTSCSGASNTSGSAIEAYYRTLVSKNEAKTAGLACAAFEAEARRDSKTFAQFPATADNVQCQQTGTDGETAIVSCTGQLTLDYNGDKQQVDLAARQYRAIQEAGSWKMCGYK